MTATASSARGGNDPGQHDQTNGLAFYAPRTRVMSTMSSGPNSGSTKPRFGIWRNRPCVTSIWAAVLLRDADQFRHGRRRAARVFRASLSRGHGQLRRGFQGYRLDEVLGAWKPFAEVVHNAAERSCKRIGIPFKAEDAQRINDEVPTRGPHPDVPAGLIKVAKEIPLVILSNSMNNLIMSNVEKVGAPFHTVITAEEVGAYKPLMKGFEYRIDKLGCGPEDITHVSSSFRYDLMPAYDLGIKSKVWVNRGHEPANPFYEYTEIKDIGGLAAAVGLEPALRSA